MTPHRLSGRLSRLGDMRSSQATEHILSLASKTLDLMRDGLSQPSCQDVCRLLLPETTAIAVAMTDTEGVLAYEGALAADFPPGSPIHTAATLEVLQTGQLGMFQTRGEDDPANTGGKVPELPRNVRGGIVVPLNVQNRTYGTIKFYFRSPADIDRTQLAIARGFGQLLSTQLSTHELDRQAELTAKAEVKALQAQINPHFLFNTINTIAAFTRTDPTQARALLREFAVFYRQTLESSDQLIPLSRELEQTRRYLRFEHARFGEDRIRESEHIAPGCGDVLVPSFIVQPVVENAVRHAMPSEGKLTIRVEGVRQGDDVVISVIDDGNGMTQEACNNILHPGSTTGCGIAVGNVHDRICGYFGAGTHLEVESELGQGTTVRLVLVEGALRQY